MKVTTISLAPFHLVVILGAAFLTLFIGPEASAQAKQSHSLDLATTSGQRSSAPAAGSRNIVIVTSAKSSSIDSLALEELRAIYLKQLTARQGLELTPVQRHANSEIRQAFDRLVLKMDESQAKNYWIRKKLAGEEDPPRSFDSVNSLLYFLKKRPGAIAYVEENQLSAELLQEIVVVPLKSGKGLLTPQAEKYPLRF